MRERRSGEVEVYNYYGITLTRHCQVVKQCFMDIFGLLELQIPCSESAAPGVPERLYDASRTLAAGCQSC
jgi:hypothetical protein